VATSANQRRPRTRPDPAISTVSVRRRDGEASQGHGEERETPGTDAWLGWQGRRWRRPVSSDAVDVQSPASRRTREETRDAGVVTTEVTGDSGANPPERLISGDALAVARAMAAEGLARQVDLIYLDPPFASRAAYVHEARLDGPADGRVVRAPAYDDRWSDGIGGYLEMLAPRLDALAELLSPRGTIWVHVDWRASYLVRLLLDEILGRDAFKNEIVWRRAPNLGRQAASNQFGRTLDTIVVYGRAGAKLTPPTRLEPIPPAAVRWDGEGRPFTCAPRGDYTDESIRRLDEVGRVHRATSGKAYVKYFLEKNTAGVLCRERRVDALWTDVPPLRHARTGERTGYPTQKPRALLDRIIACASPPGGLVVDLFAGSGTTGESAYSLGRRFVLGDESPLALATARARLLRAGVPLAVQACGNAATLSDADNAGAATPSHGDNVRVAVERRGESVRVELIEPRDPLAWAIDAHWDSSGPFRDTWHSERTLGARAVRAALREATLERARGPLAVRVWYDDGRVATCIVEGA
jgi:DNA modification methylase